jgi:hypothetical protein
LIISEAFFVLSCFYEHLILIILVILIARSCLSQMANPTQYNEWETSNSYIAGGTSVMLGSMIAIAIKSLFSGIKRAGKYP